LGFADWTAWSLVKPAVYAVYVEVMEARKGFVLVLKSNVFEAYSAVFTIVSFPNVRV